MNHKQKAFSILKFFLRGFFQLLNRQFLFKFFFKVVRVLGNVFSVPLLFKKRKLAEITTSCHSFSFVVTRCTTCCTTRCTTLSFALTHFHSRPLIVSLVVTRCITVLSFYKRSIFSNYRN